MTAPIHNSEMPQVIDQKEKPAHKKSSCWLVLLLILVIAFLCALAAGYGYLRLAKVNLALAGMAEELKQQATHDRAQITTLNAALTNIDAIAQKSQQLSTQQEQLMTEWRAAEKGDLNRWHIAEAAYMVNLANQQLKYASNRELALQLLTEAQNALQNVAGTDAMRDKLSQDIATLKAAPDTDITALYSRLTALDKMVDQLPLVSYPLKTSATVTTDAQTSATETAPSEQSSWWQAGFHRAWQSISNMIVVRDMRETALPLGLPDEKLFLYQNMHAQFANAIWGALHRSQPVYIQSLVNIAEWLKQYFNGDAEGTRTMMAQLDELKTMNVAPITYELNDTMTLFEQSLQQKSAS